MIIPILAQIKPSSILVSHCIDQSPSKVTEVKEGSLTSLLSQVSSTSVLKVVNGPLPQCPLHPGEAFHIQRAAFACFNVVTALFAFPAKA